MNDQANTTVSELLPCPFCGDKAISGTTLDDFGYVVCVSEKCWGMAGYLPSEAEAIAAWNRRATADVTEAAEALAWAMDEIDALSNKLSGFAYPQGMAYARRADHQEAYVRAVSARKALAALNPPVGR